MSSTNRRPKEQKSGGEKELYPTPSYPVHRLLEPPGPTLPGGHWLEAGAGYGSIIRAVNEVRSDIEWTAIEMDRQHEQNLRSVAKNVFIEPFQHWATRAIRAGDHYDVACFNPPFTLAVRFVELCWQLCTHVVLLERSPWIGDSIERYDLFHKDMPDEYRVGRIDFDGDGGDSVPYSWFAWNAALGQRTRGNLILLRPTPLRQKTLAPTFPSPVQRSLF